MNKYKKILTTIILFILIIMTVLIGTFSIFSNTTEATTNESDTNEEDFPAQISLSLLENYTPKVWSEHGHYRYTISADGTFRTNWAYCVQKGASTYEKPRNNGEYGIGDLRHRARRVVKIKGNVAQWYSVINEQGVFKANKVEGKWTELDNNGNALLAAILCATETPDGETLSLGCQYPNYSDSQNALYDYWNEWLKATTNELKAKGFTDGHGLGGGGENDDVKSPYMSDYQELTELYNYEVTIIYLEHAGPQRK